MPNKQAF